MYHIRKKATGRKMVQVAEEKGVSLADAAIQAGADPYTARMWSMGKALPTLDNFINLADVFGCRVEDLLVWEEIND